MGVAYCPLWRIPTREILSSALSRRHARTRARYRTPPHACPRPAPPVFPSLHLSPFFPLFFFSLFFLFSLPLLSLTATAFRRSAVPPWGHGSLAGGSPTVEKFQGEIEIDRESTPNPALSDNGFPYRRIGLVGWIRGWRMENELFVFFFLFFSFTSEKRNLRTITKTKLRRRSWKLCINCCERTMKM